MSNVYNIDWDEFIVSNIPNEEQQPKTISWLKFLFKPIIRIHIEFLAFRNQALYKVNHNSQICYLQAVLNDIFDNTQRRIIIRNAKLREPLWFYEPEENKPVVFYEPEHNKPVYFREESEFIGRFFGISTNRPKTNQHTGIKRLNHKDARTIELLQVIR